MNRFQISVLFCILGVLVCPNVPAFAGQNTAGPKTRHEIVFWESVRGSDSIELYRAYVKNYPNGHFVPLAKIKIKTLSKSTPPPETMPKAPVRPSVRKRITLRSKPVMLGDKAMRDFYKRHNFSIPKGNPDGQFENAFVDNQDGTISDEVTGLIWQARHTTSKLNLHRAKNYVRKLNRERFGGRTGWRLPTLEELASLVEGKPQPPQWLHLDPIFQDSQRRTPDIFWSADANRSTSGCYVGAWVIDFWRGAVRDAGWGEPDCISSMNDFYAENYVRAVCSQ